MSIDIRLASEKEWIEFEEKQQRCTIFHTWKWLKIIERHTKSNLFPIIGLKGGIIIGIYPLFYMKKIFFKSVFSPPPWVAVPYLGPLIVNYDELRQDKKESILLEFQRKVDEFITSEINPHYLQIKSSPGLLDSRPFKWNDYNVEPLYNYLIDLSRGEDHVKEQFKRNLRNDLKRIKKCTIFIEEGSRQELEWIIDSISERYKEQGKLTSISKEYVLDLYDAFYPQNMKIFIAKHDGKLIGGLVNIYYKNKILNWLGNVKANVDGFSPNDLLHWEAMKWAIKHDLRYYELIGANTERLCSYKSKYNPKLLICFSARRYSSPISKMAEKIYLKLLK